MEATALAALRACRRSWKMRQWRLSMQPSIWKTAKIEDVARPFLQSRAAIEAERMTFREEQNSRRDRRIRGLGGKPVQQVSGAR
jgi:hypothetical protein